MKKTFRIVGTMALCAVLMPAFTSCGDDGDEPEGPVDVPVIENEDGETLRLSSVGNCTLEYDSKGRVIEVRSYSNVATIDYNKGTFSLEDDDEYENAKISFNGKGYVTEVSSSWNYTDEDGTYKGTGGAKFSYNGSGNMTKAEFTTKETCTEDGEKYTFSETCTINYTWKDGNMVSATSKDVEVEDGEKDTYVYTYDYEYGSTENYYKQNPFSISYVLFEDPVFQGMAAAGLFGVGPKYLPSYLTEEDDDDYDSYSRSISYTLNTNDAISMETFGSNRYSWKYETTKSAPMFTEQPSKKTSMRNFFVKKARK